VRAVVAAEPVREGVRVLLRALPLRAAGHRREPPRVPLLRRHHHPRRAPQVPLTTNDLADETTALGLSGWGDDEL
jgi:hypothetical protein